jgi:hypothetical protein
VPYQYLQPSEDGLKLFDSIWQNITKEYSVYLILIDLSIDLHHIYAILEGFLSLYS